ncbi:MAG TPA: MBL fold metallo-hydrolase [Methylophilaceae bacterium]|nr:MBL fold metallo-hydrolase [Methylophilaceae bacterium]HAJ71633.1 MBL fold metallo-hydrolase [Methylophilaceae bacterium]
MGTELFNNGHHVCISFSDLVDDSGSDAVQSNQFLIVTDGHGALIDPGGNMTYNALMMSMGKYFHFKQLEYIFASHQDPDIVASINKWLIGTECQVYAPAIWERFLPHFCGAGKTEGRITGIPDAGMSISLGNTIIKAIPAHFLHSEGNFQFYDVTSKILFSGDLGASVVPHERAARPVTDFESHIPKMAGFHKRYMVSNKACRYWAHMVRKLEIKAIVPQHGQPFLGEEMVSKLIKWIENLECGIDLFTQEHYQIPK